MLKTNNYIHKTIKTKFNTVYFSTYFTAIFYLVMIQFLFISHLGDSVSCDTSTFMS